jgi:M6 family metalloprotease-like protein
MFRTLSSLTLLAYASSLTAYAQSDKVRTLNARVLQLQGEIQRTANAAQQAQIRSQARGVLAERAAALSDLIKTNPAEAIGLSFAQGLLSDLAGRFPDSASSLEQQGTWSGVSEHVVIDDAQRMTRRYEVRLRNGADTLQVFSATGEPGCTSGQTLRVTGVRVGNVAAAGSNTVQSAGVASAGCSTTGAQSTAVLLVQFPGVALPSNVTNAGLYDSFFGSTGRSLDRYWREASYGKAWMTGNVFGPLTLDRSYTCSEYSAMRSAAIAAADSMVNFTQYNRIFIVFPDSGGCGWAGLGTLGCNSLSSADGSFQASTSWLLATHMGSKEGGAKLAAHEGGHNLGLHHSSTRDFGAEALGPLGSAGALDEYGDPFNVMGTWGNFGHYAAPHKAMIGWLSGSNTLSAESSGSYGVQSLSQASAGLQGLKVRRGTGNDAWLWVEYRGRNGEFDNSLGSTAAAGAVVHFHDSTTGTRTHLLDFTPGTSSFGDGVLTGTWQDPYSNLSLSVSGGYSSALNVAVSYGAVPCTRALPALSLTPPNPSAAAGASTNYTLTLTNRDSSGCTASSFSLASSLPAGWLTTFSPASLTLSPGQTLTASMTKSVAASITPGTYAVDAAATSPNHAAVTAMANISVTAPVQPITVSLAAAPTVLSARSNLSLQATVRNASGPVANASVTFRLVRSNGSVQTQSAATNSSGVATWTQRINQKGAYSASASATANGASATSASVTITVN